MIGVLSRHSPLALLAGVLLAQVLLLAYQIKRDHDVRLIRYWSAQSSMPFARGGTWFFSNLGGFWSGYVNLHNAHKENAQLRQEVGQLRLRNSELENKAAEEQRLETLLNFRNAHPEVQMIAAQVISASADPASDTMFINRGDQDRIRRNMAVITPDGVVGKIVEVLGNTSQVMLMTDKDMGVGALFADTRTHGVVKGSGESQPKLDYIVNDEKVSAGQVLLTSGEDKIFPKGLLIGAIASAKEGNPFQVIRVSPAARLDRLEDVLVLTTLQELAPRKSGEPFTVSPAPPAPPPSPAPAASQTNSQPAARLSAAPAAAAPQSATQAAPQTTPTQAPPQ